MNKREFVKRVTEVLRESNARKPITVPKQVFHISDDEGNSKDFTVQKVDKKVIYTIDDVSSILDACLYVLCDALKHGDEISIHGYGTLGLTYRKPRVTKHVTTKEETVIAGRWVPHFKFGNELRRCGSIYEMSLDDRFGGVTYDDEELRSDGS